MIQPEPKLIETLPSEALGLLVKDLVAERDQLNIDYRMLREKFEKMSLELRNKIEVIKKSASKMIQAYEPSYDNEWMYQDVYGVEHRRSWEKDQQVREELKKAIEKC